MDHCPLHEKQAGEIDNMAVVMSQIANNVLWLTSIGKWALGVIGACVLGALSTIVYFNTQLQDLTVTVKQSEVRISSLIEQNSDYRWDEERR